MCSHAGQATPTAPSPRVLVANQPVVTISSPYMVAGCTMPPPPSGNGPCVTAQFTTSALRVMAGGQPVLLQNSQATCVPTGTPLMITVTQMRVLGS
jgi:hypothetical protein